MGVSSLGSAQERLEELSQHLELDPQGRGKLGLEKIPGLSEWLLNVGLAGRASDVDDWWPSIGASSLGTIRDNVEDLAVSLQLKAPARAKLGLERIPGLAAWLSTMELEAREADVYKWCEDAGRESVSEVREHMEELAQFLQLAPEARGRLGLEKIPGLAKWLDRARLGEAYAPHPRHTQPYAAICSHTRTSSQLGAVEQLIVCR